MRQAIAILILVGLAALLYFSPSIYRRTDEDPLASLTDAVIEEDEILELAKAMDGSGLVFSVDQIQQSPEQLMNFNAKLMKVMYSWGEEVSPLSDDEIAMLVNVQREYYHEDLLAVNQDPFFHALKAVEEVRQAQENETWIVDYKIGPAAYSDEDPNVAVVQLTIIPSDLGDNVDYYQQYLLEREEGLWYIKGWAAQDEESVKVFN